MTNLTCSTVHGTDALRRLLPELDDLHSEVGAPISTRTLWLIVWAETHPAYTPVCVIIRSSKQVEAAAVLAQRRVLGCDVLVGAGHTLSEQIWLAARNEPAARALAEAIAAFLRSLARPWFLDLRQLPVGDPAAAELLRLLPTGEMREGVSIPHTRFDSGRAIEGYMSRKYRQTANSARRKLSRQYEWSCVWLRDPLAIEQILPELEAIRRARDNDLGRVADLDRGGGAFWRRLVTAPTGGVEIATLVANGHPAAYCVCLRDGPTRYAWDARVAPDYMPYWAGNLVLAEVLRDSLADPGIQRIDWGRGEGLHKARFATDVEPAQELCAWSSPTARRTYELVERARAELAAYKNRSVRLSRLWHHLRRTALLVRPHRHDSTPGDALYDTTRRASERGSASGDSPRSQVPGGELEPEDPE